jgi:hypothetical protein
MFHLVRPTRLCSRRMLDRGVRLAAVVAPGANDTRSAHRGLTRVRRDLGVISVPRPPPGRSPFARTPTYGPAPWRDVPHARARRPAERYRAEVDPTAIKVLGSGNGHFSEAD